MATEADSAAQGDAFSVAVGDLVVRCFVGLRADDVDRYTAPATQIDRLGTTDAESCCILVSRVDASTPFLAVAMEGTSTRSPFGPGVLLAAEVDRLFIGVDEHVAAYDLAAPKRLWARQTVLFWGWARHGDVVLMSSELELAAWTITGEPLWTTSVEPPWDYGVKDGVVALDGMGSKREFPVRGPPGIPAVTRPDPTGRAS